MSVLVACEFSGIVRDAFLGVGVDAVSCDLLPTDRPGQHIEGNVLDHLDGGWEAMIAFPPCTYLCNSGARWWSGRQAEQRDAIRFVQALHDAPIPRVAIENPYGILSTVWRKPDQVIHPYMFGHGETKATCLWLRGLPPLMVGVQDTGREARVHREPPGADRWKRRSATMPGVAAAMAAQWSSFVSQETGSSDHQRRVRFDDCHSRTIGSPELCGWPACDCKRESGITGVAVPSRQEQPDE